MQIVLSAIGVIAVILLIYYMVILLRGDES